MNQRERLLAIGVATLVGLLALYYVYDTIAGKFADRDRQISNLNQAIAKKQSTLDAGARAQKKLNQWQRRSLPSDAKQAPSLYQSWLLRLIDEAKLDSATMQQQSTVGRSAAFEKYAFQIKADADISMKQLVQFLYGFYTANHLHKIRQIMLKPQTDGKALDVTIDIEALLLPGADRQEKLSSEKLDHLALGDVTVYQKTIGDRKLFSEYVPPHAQPAKVESRRTPPVDVTKYTMITGIVDDDKPQIWVYIKTTGETLKLHEGDNFNVGDVKCKVVKIGVRQAIITAEGKDVQLSLGESLHDGKPVPTEEL